MGAHRKIHILYCIEYLAHGGAEKQLMQLINGLDRERFVPHLCCLRTVHIGENRKTEALKLFSSMSCAKLQLDYGSPFEFGSLSQILSLFRYIKKNHIDIVQTYFQDPTLLGFLVGRLAGVKHLIACLRDMAFWIQEDKLQWALKQAYRLGTDFIANSEAVQKRYVSLFSLEEKRFTVIYNGIDLGKEPLFPLPKRKNSQVVGIVANLNRHVKRVDLFLEAAARVKQWDGSVHFVVIGDGELREGLEQQGRDLGLDENLSFLGRISNVVDLLTNEIDVGVLSSDSEGFSNSILEYMANGVPVVATDVGGNGEIIENGINGFLAQRGDPNDIAEKIIQLLGNKDLYGQIRKNAFLKVVQEYSLANCIQQYENFYEQLILNSE